MANSHLVSAMVVWTQIALLVLALGPPGAFAAASPELKNQIDGLFPSPELEPGEVVRIQVEALRTNSALNQGIELTYRFASSDNKSFTGPLERFTEMVRSAPYDRLLNHMSARYGPLAVAGDEAYQTVAIIDKWGEELAYIWVLALQSEGDFKDCWMTDAVIPAEKQTGRKLTQNIIPGTP